MSLARPTTLPVWATGGIVTVPSAGKQATGWEQNEAPPFDFFNWHQNLTYEWIDYLDRKVPAAPTVGYEYTSPVTGVLDISPSAGTALTIYQGGYLFYGGSSIDVDLVGMKAVINLSEQFQRISSIATDPVTVTTIELSMKVEGGTFSATVERWPKVNTGLYPQAVSPVKSNDVFTPSVNFQTITITMNAAIDIANYVYRLNLVASSVPLTAYIRIASIKVNYTKTRVE